MMKLSPTSFHWRVLENDPNREEKLQQASDVINSMTNEQKSAVEEYGHSHLEYGFDDGYSSNEGGGG